MKRLAFLVPFFPVTVGCAADSLEDPSMAIDAPIVGGQRTARDPAVVAINIVSTGLAVCTGTLVAPRAVLTAGHCPQSAIWVRQGESVRGLGWRDHVDVKSAARHPSYTGEGKPYDLALLELDAALDGVTPVPLSEAPLGSADIGSTVRHVGFGTTGDDWHFIGQIATGGLKREASYPITKIDEHFVFSGGPGQQSCLFDSGGPTLREKDGEERLIAVVSNGVDCHSDGWDTRVDRPDVLSWIDQQLAAWGTKR